jgi:hypothetical protein
MCCCIDLGLVKSHVEAVAAGRRGGGGIYNGSYLGMVVY